MNKKTYLLLLLLIGLQFFNIVVFQPIFNFRYMYEILLIIWLFIGYWKWGRGHLKYYKKELRYWYWLLIGICSSIIPLYITIGQTPLHSLWIYKGIIIVYCCIPVLLSIGYRYDEIIDTTFTFSIIYAFVFILVAIFPMLKAGNINEAGNIKDVSDGNYGYILNGIEILLFPLYAYSRQYTNSHNIKALYKVIFLIILIFLIQNRSILFPAFIFTAFILLKRPLMRFIIIVSFVLILYIPNLNPIQNLIQQTKEESISDENNRNIAYGYYLKENFSSARQIIFGTGIQSTHTSNQQEKFRENESQGIFASDVGFLGFMNTYGIIPIIIFLIILFKPIIFWKAYTLDIKIMALHILLCSATISYFDSFIHTIWLILFVVLSSIEHRSLQSMNINNKFNKRQEYGLNPSTCIQE